MTRQIQKNEEMRLVQQMRRALGGTPAGQIEPVDEPDVCIATSDRRVGIEVTELHQGSGPGQAQRRLQESERSGNDRMGQVAGRVASGGGAGDDDHCEVDEGREPSRPSGRQFVRRCPAASLIIRKRWPSGDTSYPGFVCPIGVTKYGRSNTTFGWPTEKVWPVVIVTAIILVPFR